MADPKSPDAPASFSPPSDPERPGVPLFLAAPPHRERLIVNAPFDPLGRPRLGMSDVRAVVAVMQRINVHLLGSGRCGRA